MALVVRPATVDDVPDIVAVYLASWRAGYAGLLPGDVVDEQVRHRAAYDWADAIAAAAGEVRVAVDGSTIVGVVEVAEPPGGERDLPEIVMLYVEPSAWGGPAARRLLAAGTSWIARRGYRAARLRVVSEQARARRFYEREGWCEDPSRAPAHNGLFPLVYYRRAV